MAHVGTLRDYRFQGDIDDIRGSNIYNRNDDKLGEIDDVIFNHNSGDIEYLVVDTGGWLSSRKFLVPADRVSATDDDDRYIVDLTKDQIERFPAYDEKVHEGDRHWNDYENRYRESWTETGGILHKEGSQNILTPDADEMPPASGDVRADVTPTRIAPKFTDPAPTSDKTRLRPEGIASRAEDTKTPGTARTTERSDWEETDPALEGQRIRREREESGIRPDESAYGDARRTAVDAGAPADPEAYRGRVGDVSNDLARPYPVQQGRGERWRAFEDNLRKNRVDITASCHSCSPAKDEAA